MIWSKIKNSRNRSCDKIVEEKNCSSETLTHLKYILRYIFNIHSLLKYHIKLY